MFEMRQEISSLRAFIPANSSMPPSLFMPQFSGSPSLSTQQPPRPASPISPVSQSSSQPPFVEGPPAQTLSIQQQYYVEASNHTQEEQQEMLVERRSQTTPLTPQLAFAESSTQQPETSSTPRNRRKRQSPHMTSEDGEGSSGSDSSGPPPDRPLKRKSHHDKRCLTIHVRPLVGQYKLQKLIAFSSWQHAVRAHILRLMQIDSDKELPDGHSEGAPLEPREPVRFVWDKTPKQSVHNGRMKARILADLKSNRRMYKHVPDKDFSKKTLDSVFDQAFVTLRQKFKVQRDAWTALNQKKKEDSKALKSRRLSRRKTVSC